MIQVRQIIFDNLSIDSLNSFCQPVNFQDEDRYVVDVCELLMLHSMVCWSCKPIGSGLAQEHFRKFLSTLVSMSWIIDEVGHLLIGHHVPDAVRS